MFKIIEKLRYRVPSYYNEKKLFRKNRNLLNNPLIVKQLFSTFRLHVAVTSLNFNSPFLFLERKISQMSGSKFFETGIFETWDFFCKH